MKLLESNFEFNNFAQNVLDLYRTPISYKLPAEKYTLYKALSVIRNITLRAKG